MSVTVRPFLMFEGRASEAIELWTSLIPGSSVGKVTRYGPEGPGKEGTIITAEFSLGGQSVIVSDSFVSHGFTFTPSFSFFVDCPSEEELRRLAQALGADGEVLMPVDNYGFSRLFTWVSDRFGVSWQLNLPA